MLSAWHGRTPNLTVLGVDKQLVTQVPPDEVQENSPTTLGAIDFRTPGSPEAKPNARTANDLSDPFG